MLSKVWRLALAAAVLIAGCSHESSTSSSPTLIDGKTALASRDYPAMLAVLDAGGAVDSAGPEIVAMRKRLKAVDDLFPEGEKEIADMTVAARDRLAESSHRLTLAKILDDSLKVKAVAKNGKSPIKFQEWSAAYIVTISKAQARTDRHREKRT